MYTKRFWIGISLLFLCVLIVYANTFNSSWHFDDFHNIVNNSNIHINTLFELPSIFFNNGDLIKRPVAMSTFALNWAISKDSVYSYHIFNIIIHIFTAIILFFVILKLQSTPKLFVKNFSKRYFIALFAVVLWSIHPIQTQAVTYIVQRMASLAGLFYVSGIFAYISYRNEEKRNKKLVYIILCFLFYILGIGSKENAVLLPVSLLLIEVCFYSKPNLQCITKKQLLYICTGVVAFFSISILAYYIFENNPLLLIEKLEQGYEKRNFSLTERLLTEPRVLIFYLTQIFYPVTDRFSIVHDIEISKSLFHPWTTLFSILSIIVAIFYSLKKINVIPVCSFAVLFYFLNHAVESSIFPLELIFEHRNYIPSMFLFFPVAILLYYLLYELELKKIIKQLLAICVTAVIILVGLATYSYNYTWQTEYSLWSHVVKKSPQSARGYHNLGKVYYKNRQYKKSLQMNLTALNKFDQSKGRKYIASFTNIGLIYLYRYNMPHKSIKYYKQALSVDHDNKKALKNLTNAYIKIDELEKAMLTINRLIANYNNLEYKNIKTLILIKKNSYKRAYNYLNTYYKIAPLNRNTLLNLSYCLYKLNKIEKMKHYDKILLNKFPNDLMVQTMVLSHKLDYNIEKSVEIMKHLLNSYKLNEIKTFLSQFKIPNLYWPIEYHKVKDNLQKQACQFIK